MNSLRRDGRPGDYLHALIDNDSKFPVWSNCVTCTVGHKHGVCRCNLPIILMGQDESIFKAYSHSSRHWTVTGKKRLLPKSEGVGEMVSAVQDEWTGFGLNLTPEQLAKVNIQRLIDGLSPFVESPGIRYLEYGKNKEGYWDFEEFNEQVKDIIYCFNIIYPGYQLV